MSFGISPDDVDNMTYYEMIIYSKLIPLYQEYVNENMIYCIKKAISDVMG